MKLKSMQGFPEKKECKHPLMVSEEPCGVCVNCHTNQALSELGELEVSLDVEKINKIIQSKMSAIYDYKPIAQAIANSKEVVRIKEEGI